MRISREVAGESSAHEDPLELFLSDDEDPLAKEIVISVLNDQLRNPIKSLDRLPCIPCSPSEPCELCGCLEDPLKMLICDRCEKAFHLSCCNPKVNKLEGDDWICELCENRIGRDFQVDVPEWSSANSINQCDDEPLEMAPSNFTGLNVKELNFKKTNSLGNWIQCQGKVKDKNGQVIICGKWKRAPLFTEQSKK